MMTGWDGDNFKVLKEFADRNIPAVNGSERAVAVFDWDNTVVRNDIGDYFFKWMLEHNLFKSPDWRTVSPYLTEKAVVVLANGCHDEHGFINGSIKECSDLLYGIYYNGTLPDGSKAFFGFDSDLFEPSYAFLAQLMSGYNLINLRLLCEQAVKDAVREKAVMIYPQMQWLIDTLKKDGFEVWVISASPQLLIEPFAELAGIKKENVIGVRNIVRNGVVQKHFEGCGPFAEGSDRIMTYRIGKRCWMNEIIFGIKGEKALLPAENPAKRPRFAAGDSDTDLHFMMDATGLRLLINRNKPEITKEARKNSDGKWLINEPFSN